MGVQLRQQDVCHLVQATVSENKHYLSRTSTFRSSDIWWYFPSIGETDRGTWIAGHSQPSDKEFGT